MLEVVPDSEAEDGLSPVYSIPDFKVFIEQGDTADSMNACDVSELKVQELMDSTDVGCDEDPYKKIPESMKIRMMDT